jgi:peroxiredoxin
MFSILRHAIFASLVMSLVHATSSIAAEPAAVVITPSQTVALESALIKGGELWVTPADLTKINGLVLKPEGACLGDLCIPISKDARQKLLTTSDGKEYFNLSAFAAQQEQAVVADADAKVWSFGVVPPVEQMQLQDATAPDFALSNRKGETVRLSDYRGKKVLLLTWASWCQCKQDLVGWQHVYEDLKDENFEIIAAAQDTGGEEAAGSSYDKAKATYTTLLDPQHTVSSLYKMVNVPTGVWIDEQGKIVRPSEVAYSRNVALLSIKVEGDKYVDALRDWVKNGDKSEFVVGADKVQTRLATPSKEAALADANFKLAVYFHQQKNDAQANKYFAEAQRLQPDDWNYHRQQWSFDPQTAIKLWMQKYTALGEKPYYEPLVIEPTGK